MICLNIKIWIIWSQIRQIWVIFTLLKLKCGPWDANSCEWKSRSNYFVGRGLKEQRCGFSVEYFSDFVISGRRILLDWMPVASCDPVTAYWPCILRGSCRCGRGHTEVTERSQVTVWRLYPWGAGCMASGPGGSLLLSPVRHPRPAHPASCPISPGPSRQRDRTPRPRDSWSAHRHPGHWHSDARDR